MDKIKKIVSLIILFYIGSYSYLSISGKYEPAEFGGKGVKYYRWEPLGYNGLSPRAPSSQKLMYISYLPLYWIDFNYIHNDKYKGGCGTFSLEYCLHTLCLDLVLVP